MVGCDGNIQGINTEEDAPFSLCLFVDGIILKRAMLHRVCYYPSSRTYVCVYVCMYVCVYVQDVSKNLYGLQRINFVVLTKSHLTLMHALYTYTHI